jgi:polar amino acid transport system substrate-binding protein
MKNEICLMIFLIVFGFLAACGYADTNKIILVTGEWPPATSEKLPNYGFIAEIVSAACKEAGIIPEYKFLPWKRAEMMIKRGHFFGTFPFMVTDERKKDCYFSDTLFYGINYFVYYDKNPKTPKSITYENLEDLKEYTIGMISGTSMEEELKSAGLKVEVTATMDQSLKKLTRGRIDFE